MATLGRTALKTVLYVRDEGLRNNANTISSMQSWTLHPQLAHSDSMPSISPNNPQPCRYNFHNQELQFALQGFLSHFTLQMPSGHVLCLTTVSAGQVAREKDRSLRRPTVPCGGSGGT